MAQVNSSAGVKKRKIRAATPSPPVFTQTYAASTTDEECEALKSSTDINLDTNPGDIDSDCLPESWDWTNINGVSYVPPITEQGDCGSCYIMSTLTMLSSRLQIQTGNEHKVKLSP